MEVSTGKAAGFVTSPQKHTNHKREWENEPNGHTKDELFPPTSKIWDVCGRAQLAAGVFLSAAMCIYGRPDPARFARQTARHSLA